VVQAYRVHPISLPKWKGHFLEHGAEVFAEREQLRIYEKSDRRTGADAGAEGS